MDQEDPNGFIVLRRKALRAQRDLQDLAEAFRLAIKGVKEPSSLDGSDVRMLCEAFLRSVKPTISTGRGQL